MPIPEEYQEMFEDMKLSFLERQDQSRLENWEWTVNDEIVEILMKTSCAWETKEFVEEHYFKLQDDLFLKIRERQFKKFIKEKMAMSEEKVINAWIQKLQAQGIEVSIDDIEGFRRIFRETYEEKLKKQS